MPACVRQASGAVASESVYGFRDAGFRVSELRGISDLGFRVYVFHVLDWHPSYCLVLSREWGNGSL